MELPYSWKFHFYYRLWKCIDKYKVYRNLLILSITGLLLELLTLQNFFLFLALNEWFCPPNLYLIYSQHIGKHNFSLPYIECLS